MGKRENGAAVIRGTADSKALLSKLALEHWMPQARICKWKQRQGNAYYQRVRADPLETLLSTRSRERKGAASRQTLLDVRKEQKAISSASVFKAFLQQVTC